MAAQAASLRLNKSCSSSPQGSPLRLPRESRESCPPPPISGLGPPNASPLFLDSPPTLLGSSSPPLARDSCCPIPAADWRSLSQERADDDSPERPARPSLVDLHRESLSRGSSPLVRCSSDHASFSDSEAGPAVGQRATSRRRSMSSLGVSAAEARIQQHYKEQLAVADRQAALPGGQAGGSGPLAGGPSGPAPGPPGPLLPLLPGTHPAALGAAPATAKAAHPGAGLVPRPGSSSGSIQLSTAQRRESEGPYGTSSSAPVASMEGGAPEPEGGITRAQSIAAEPDCVNWAEVEELCANMDEAGLTLEDIDILCCSPVAAQAKAEMVASKGKDKSGKTLLSLKFSSMSLRHYPGDDSTKKLFQNVLSR